MWLLKGMAYTAFGAILLSVLAAVAFGLSGDHPECSQIPQDVAPCGFWPRVGYIGPFVVLWGTVFGTPIVAIALLIAVGASRLAANVLDDEEPIES
ncbi:hypothetical protein AB0H76_19495 [Nocardia sp. NPDC050712]|uniref:hypothetical protein n=1 Tax=Nocardia sp. NPDC050712 TaxID=3155518 RepID=UPI0034054B7D